MSARVVPPPAATLVLPVSSSLLDQPRAVPSESVSASVSPTMSANTDTCGDALNGVCSNARDAADVSESDVSSWGFSAFADPAAHPAQFCSFFAKLGLADRFGLRTEKLVQLFECARTYYHPHHYHNFTHAFDVVQALYMFLAIGRACEILSPVEQLALLVAGLCHDLDHPGYTNEFAVLSHSPIAERYAGCRNVLERHHIEMARTVIDSDAVRLTEGMNEEERGRFLNVLDSSIRATFMGDHKTYMEKMRAFLDDTSTAPQGEEYRLLLCQMLLKAADIFNQARPFEVAAQWSNTFQDECWNEGDLRRAKGFPLGMFMDRENPVPLPKMQAGFIGGFIEPLLRIIVEALPAASCVVDELEKTKARWKELCPADDTQ